MEERIKKITDIFKRTYPDARIVLNYGNNWELLTAVVLSAQCTDKKVNEVTAKLFPKYQKSKNKKQKTKSNEKLEIFNFANAPLTELENDIRSTGFYRNKAKNIQRAAKMILEKFGGKLPRTMAEMLTLPGVARKTANVVLGNAYGIVEGIAVDTHVLRLSQRLRLVSLDKIGGGNKPLYYIKEGIAPAVRSPLPGLKSTRPPAWTSSMRSRAGRGVPSTTLGTGRSVTTGFGCALPANIYAVAGGGPSEKRLDYYKDASPEKVEGELMKLIPKRDWFNLTYWLIDHGRAICKAQNPDCSHCPLNKICPVSRI